MSVLVPLRSSSFFSVDRIVPVVNPIVADGLIVTVSIGVREVKKVAYDYAVCALDSI